MPRTIRESATKGTIAIAIVPDRDPCEAVRKARVTSRARPQNSAIDAAV